MFSKIKSLHLELTDKCQAACPQCPRTNVNTGKKHNWISNTDLSINDIKNIFTPSTIESINKIVLGGNFGDPLISKDFISIIEYFFSCNPNIKIRVSTNGSFYNPTWWSDLAKKFSGYHFKAVFAIEGVDQTTHSFYRRGTNYQKVYDNAKSFVESGGAAVALCLVYEHNQDQLEKIKEKNKLIGLDTSFLGSERFWKGDQLDFVYKNKSYTLKKASISLKNNSDIEGELDYNSNISCFSKNDNHIYVDSSGYVSPCCFLGAYLYAAKNNKFKLEESNFGLYQDDLIEGISLYKDYDLEILNAKKHDINEILNSKFFKDLEKYHIDKKPKKCLRTCGNTPFKKI